MEFSITHRFGMKRNDNFYFRSFSDFSNLKAWNEAKMLFYFNIFNFLAIFLEFSIMHWVGTERNDNFYFRSFSDFSNLEARNEAIMVVSFNFLNFFGIFYHASDKNETERKFLFSLFLILFEPIMAWNESTMVFFNFWNFFSIFFNFLLRVGQEWNGTIIFIFSISHPFPTYNGLKWIHNGIF